MSEQPTTPPPAGRTPTLGRGLGRWSAHIDGDLPPTEPYQPPPRTRPPGGWPKTGNLGASATLTADEQPATVPARPYAEICGAAAELADQLTATAAAAREAASWFARAIGWFRR